MPRPNLLRLSGVAIFFCVSVHAQQAPLFKGHVTRTGTPADFDVDGVHITCTATTAYREPAGAVRTACLPHAFGEHLAVFGKRNGTADTIAATEIDSIDNPAGQTVRGLALIDKVFSPGLLRADGFAIRLTPTTETHWELPLTSSSKPAVNQWLEYLGKRDSNGVIIADSVIFYTSIVTPREQKLRNKNEFDAATVSEDDKQGKASKFFKGADLKRLPAVHDEVQQSRIDRIATRLIPAWQKSLAVDDPDRINFRFQLVDSKANDALTFPNGIILVPAHVASRLDDDDELAAVLAANIAAALEKETLRHLTAYNALATANVVADSALIISPGASLATWLGAGITGNKMQKHLEERTGRTSLVLLHDAGFDIRQAPIAWWRLSSKTDDFMQKSAPREAAYLFETLATSWRPSSPLLDNPAAPIASAGNP